MRGKYKIILRWIGKIKKKKYEDFEFFITRVQDKVWSTREVVVYGLKRIPLNTSVQA